MKLRCILFLSAALLWVVTSPAIADFDYTSDGTNITITGYLGAGGIVIIPDIIDGLPVTTIGNSAFFYETSITSVSIPDSVTAIGISAFAGCSGLTSISVDAANLNYSSLDGVLFDKLQTELIQYPGGKTGSYTIPASVTTIGQRAFDNCSGLTSVSIGSGVTTIGSYAFLGCSGLTGVSIPASVNTIGSSPFYGCSGLTSISVDAANLNYSSLDGVLFDKLQTELIQYPGGKAGSYTIPDSVTTIGYYAFYNCSGLTSVVIPDSVITIGVSAFDNCSGLTSIVIPDSVTTIGQRAFYNCSGLTSVSIGSGVITIGYSAFGSCSGLTSVSIGSGVTTIGTSAFGNCSGLTSVVIPDSVITIGYYAFYNCSGLTSVVIPDSVTTIGQRAFDNCSGLTSVVIPDSVITIGQRAFDNCSGLTSVSIGSGVTTIGSYPFYGCSGLTSISVDAANLKYSSLDGVLFDKLQTELIQYPGGKAGSYTIPASVTTIESSAFAYSAGLTSVVIPASVTTIGQRAFDNCSGLTSVVIPDSVITIGYDAFRGCSGLTSVSIGSGVITIMSSAFYGCSGLTSISVDAANLKYSSLDGVLFDKLQTELIQYPVGKAGSYTIPDSVTTIGYQFYNCSGLTSVVIPASVNTIGSYPFYGCSGLTSISVDAANLNYSSLDGVLFDKLQTELIQYPGGKAGSYTIPASVTTIESSAFAYSAGLTSVVIPASVTTIGQRAFDNCSGLTSVSIGSGVTTIGSYAFLGCSGLMAVYFEGNAPSTGGTDIFLNSESVIVYYLPDTTGWGAHFAGLTPVLWNPVVVNPGIGFGVQSNLFGFEIAGPINAGVVVEAAADLTSPSWTPVDTYTLTGGAAVFIDAQSTNHPARFYRLVLP